MHGNEDGTVPATFQIVHMVRFQSSSIEVQLLTQPYQIGWKPAPNQPKPLERGTGQVNLKDIL